MIQTQPLSNDAAYKPEPSRWFAWWWPKLEAALAADHAAGTADGVVYFLHAPSVCRTKIGTSNRLSARMAEIGLWCPVDVVVLGTLPGGYRLEHALHDAFAPFRARGEWFEHNEISGPLIEKIIARLVDFEFSGVVSAINHLSLRDLSEADLAALDPAKIDDAITFFEEVMRLKTGGGRT